MLALASPIKKKFAAAAVSGLTMLGGATHAQTSAPSNTRLCDELAASPYDSTHPPSVAGAFLDQIDTEAAIPACETAVKDSPNNGRLLYQLGRAYAARKQHVKAREYYGHAVMLGNVFAAYNLANYFQTDEGGERDLTQARLLFEMAAKGGVLLAMYSLGEIYESGHGVPKDDAKAWNWYAQAAAAGDSAAMQRLGIFSLHGWGGVNQDTPEAMRWLEKAAALGNADAMFTLGNLYDFNNDLPEGHAYSLPPRDYARAIEWYEKAAQLGHAEAMNNLGVKYYHGEGVQKDISKTVRWYQRAADAGSVTSMINLANMLFAGTDIPKNETEAFTFYKMAAEAGNAFAMRRTGEWLKDGIGVEKNFVEAFNWLERAAKAGDAKGMFLFAELLNSSHVAAAKAEALEYYKKAAERGDAQAKIELCWKGEPPYGPEKNRSYTSPSDFERDARALGISWIIRIPRAMEIGKGGLEHLKQVYTSVNSIQSLKNSGLDARNAVIVARQFLRQKGVDTGCNFN